MRKQRKKKTRENRDEFFKGFKFFFFLLLKGLSLSCCWKFNHLPEFDENMENLSKLFLKETAIKKLPSSLGFLVSLLSLDLENCKNIVCLPDTISELKFLLILNVSCYSKLHSFPKCLKEMKSLEELIANDTAIEETCFLLSFLSHLLFVFYFKNLIKN